MRNKLLALGLFLTTGLLQAQNDTLFIIKKGLITESYKTSEMDSIVFYNPRNLITAENISKVAIPAGSFTMGSPTTELGRNSSYETQRTVTLDGFSISQYEITNEQYALFLNTKKIGETGKYAAGAYPTQTLITASSGTTNWGLNYVGGKWEPVKGFEKHPVVMVSWYGAAEFATYVGGNLPTEAQWEYACRAGSTTPFYTGGCLNNNQANYKWANPYETCLNSTTVSPAKTQAVGLYPTNNYGLYDMAGNVEEWCFDWYGYSSAAAQTNPTGPATGDKRTLRGGNWASTASVCRSANRNSFTPTGASAGRGFRVVFTK